ncbi:MAG: amino acid ABC transporter substrate-binding protein [Actinobacteria bacterium]|nr:amino acid ABC transporter substrate-binding protein [Actinomycetota bacterium]
MKKNPLRVAIVAVAAAAVGLTMVSSPASANKTLVIASDLPKQGGSADQSASTNKAIRLLLENVNYRAGKYKIKFREYDNSTAAKGSWDDAQCAKNAQAHVAARDEIAVMGTYNSGCAKIMVPILNQDPKGPMVMVSNANTNPGLTKVWDPGEPAKFYPTGKRNYYRVVTTDDNQGAAAAQYAKELGVTKVYVLNDRQTYGQGVARSFTTNAKKQGITVLSSGDAGEGWDEKAPNYEALFTKIKALGPDMIYIGGIFDLNGGQLVKDKVKFLGSNTAVKMMMPDGFTGYPDFLALPEAAGAYLSFTGLSIDQFPKGGAAEDFQDQYLLKYGEPPTSSFSVYGAAATQVLLDAIARSNGTRKDVFEKMKTVNIPASKSVVGTQLKFDKNGDILSKDITVLIVKDKTETFVKKLTVK